MDYLVFDIEISKTAQQVMKEAGLKDEREIFNYPHRCGFSVGVVYNSAINTYKVFRSAKEMAKYLIDNKGLFVSFNGKRFDLPCLLNEIDIDTFRELQSRDHLDILADFYQRVNNKFRVSLNNIAQATLKKSKTGTGASAPALFQQGKWDELVAYCTNDVMLTKEIFEYGVHNGYITYYDSQNGVHDEMWVSYSEYLEELS